MARLTRYDYRELEREGQAKKDHRYRPHAIHEEPPQISRQQVPVRCSKGRAWPTGRFLVNSLALDRLDDNGGGLMVEGVYVHEIMESGNGA